MKAGISKHLLFDILLFTSGSVICLVLAWNLHFKDGKPVPGPGVFASDKSIYYVYLPATFIYGWDVQKFPHRCDTIYRGFILDYSRGKIVNKMTCGVAILWTPFFLVTHAVAVIYDLQLDGFSIFYQKMALVPPVIFLMLGLFFLKRFLEHYFPRYIAYGCILFIFAGTNLYYYGLVEGLMSHVHSFFLFSLYLYLLKKFFDNGKSSFSLYAAICLVVSLAILVRPTNMIILIWPFLLDAKTIKEVIGRARFFFQPGKLLTFVAIALLVFLPQFMYWKYVSGNFFHYSYGPERFLYWKNPVILPLYFSPLNGLFLYNPLVLLFVAGFLWMIVRRKVNGLLLLLTFALVTCVSGSWHMWYFGGSFGSRPFVEYYAILSLGFGWFLVETGRLKNLFARSLVVLTMVVFSYYNLRLIYLSYWYTDSVWAWDDFKTRLDRAGVLHFSRDTYTFKNDFENISFEPALLQTNLRHHQGKQSAIVDSRYPSCGIFNQNPALVVDHGVSLINATLWISPVCSDSTGACLVISVEDEKQYPWLYRSVPLNKFLTKKGKWTEASLSCVVPQWLNEPGNRLKIYLRNDSRKTFFVDDVRVRFE